MEISNFGPGVDQPGAQATGASFLSRANLGLLGIIGVCLSLFLFLFILIFEMKGFFAIVFYLIKFAPELGGSSGPRRSSKSGSSTKLKRSR